MKIGIGISIEKVQHVSNSIPLPSIWRVTETKARVASQNINYTGAVRMVGVGQTYTTLTAAAAAASDLDILQIAPGNTINLANESGGYWLVNSNTKRLLVRCNVNDSVVISQTTATAYGIRLRDCNSMTFENITFTSNQNATIVSSEAYASNNYNKFKNCIFVNNNTGSNARLFSRTSTIAGTNTIHFEFEKCTLTTNGTTPPIEYVQSGINEQILIKECTLTTKSIAINYLSNNKGKIAIYDNNFITETSVGSSILVGENINTPVYTTFQVDIRNNVFEYINGTFDHAILAGRGTDKIYCINNSFHAPAVDNANNMAIVIKTRASIIGNAYFAGNYMTSARTCYIKGASKCILKYNTWVVHSNSTWECLSVLNPASDLLSTENIIINNNFIGSNLSIRTYPTTGFDNGSASLKTCTVDDNKYFSTTNWLQDETRNYTFAQKNDFWSSSNDANSKFLSSATLGDEKTITDDSVIN